jgi:haloacetate dehalogenase
MPTLRLFRIQHVPLPGFTKISHPVGDDELHVETAGAGAPIVLLHGFPETSFCWRRVAPELAERRTVVALDLPGYGASRAPAGGPHGEGFSKREMAAAVTELMTALGHERFAVVGHDRGARVAYRLALDHPERVTHVAVLNTVPTIDQFERIGDDPSLGYWPWFLLAQPAPFPERLLEAEPEAVLEHVFATWSADPSAIDAEARAAYRSALDRSTIAAICADYRASFHIDRHHDAADRDAGRRITAPLIVVTGSEEVQLADAPAVWRRWADDVSAREVPGGHFIPEESPAELLAALVDFLD